jgi:L-ascorbate metabolism protein UlaG (beta-lactamase superfamily)
VGEDTPPAAPSPLAAELAHGIEQYRQRLGSDFAAIWQRVLAQTARPAPVARLWNVYNEGYLLRGAGERAPLLAIDLVRGQERAGHKLELLGALPPLAGLLVTHRHGDHMDPEVIRRVLDAGTPVALPGHAWEGLRERLQLTEQPEGVRVVKAGDELALDGFTVRVHEADHRSKNVPESVAYEVGFDGLTVLQAADHRGFDAPGATWPRGADVAILSVWHLPVDDAVKDEGGVPGMVGMKSDEAWRVRFGWDQRPGVADLAARLAPRQLVLGHLYEMGHEPEKLWRFLDAGLIKEALFAQAPEVQMHMLAPGECLPILPR